MGDLKIQVPHTDPIIGASYYQPLDTLHITGSFTLHNHPSGPLTPSKEDIEVTNRLKAAGELLGIKLLDHIIFNTKGHYSFLEHHEL